MSPLRFLGILQDGQVVPADDVDSWSRWMSDTDHFRVALTEVGATARVSTVFLGVDHGFISEGAPLWFETKVFGGTLESLCMRYATLEEAMQGHERVVALVKKALTS